MSEQDQRRLVFHGAIVLLVGNLCGIPLGEAASAGSGEAAMHGWRVAHSGLVMTGVMLIAIGAALRQVVLGGAATSWLVWSLLAAAYGGVVALVLAAAVGARGLAPTGPPLNLVAFVRNVGVVLGTLIGIVLLIRGTRPS
jgi:hypothetical protein